MIKRVARTFGLTATLLVTTLVGLSTAQTTSHATLDPSTLTATASTPRGIATAAISPRSSNVFTILDGGRTTYPPDSYCQRYVHQDVTWHLRGVSRTRIYVERVKINYRSNTKFVLGGGWISNGSSSVRYRTYSQSLSAGSHSFSYPIRRYLSTSGSPRSIYLKQNLQGSMSPEPIFCRARGSLIHRLVVR
jgi:hypothetical protein